MHLRTHFEVRVFVLALLVLLEGMCCIVFAAIRFSLGLWAVFACV